MSHLNRQGYLLVSAQHPRAFKGQIFEHILVLEKKLGRYLLPGEVTHHKNGIKNDNRPENLEVKLESEHNSFHNTGKILKPETREKLRIRHLGMVPSIETRVKMSKAHEHRADYHGIITYTCPVCGNNFRSADTRRITCSYACSNKQRRSRDD
jgi:predicted RNA-binding Zn-ribbon protein involved in translation (DUF1610 family)